MGSRVGRANRQLVIAGVTLLAMSIVFGAPGTHGQAADWTHRVGWVILTASGPISGWWTASFGGDLATAWGFLACATAIPVVPLLLWRRRLNPAWLGLATLLWFLVGFYCTIGMWL